MYFKDNLLFTFSGGKGSEIGGGMASLMLIAADRRHFCPPDLLLVNRTAVKTQQICE